MNRLLGGTVLVCALAGLAASADAQITITAADVSARLAVGNNITWYQDSLAGSVNIGAPGATSWDFSWLKKSSVLALKSVNPAATPYIAQFPGATHALQTTLSIEGIAGTGYQYATLGTSSVLNPGLKAGAVTALGTITYTIANSPADVTYALPSTLGTSWTSAYTETVTLALQGTPLSTATTTHNASYVVDAYGTMTLPSGYVQEALRIRKSDATSRGLKGGYIFLAKNGAIVEMTAKDTIPATSGTINVWPPVSWFTPVNTSVPLAGDVPQVFTLAQNYPNPFNPSTTIEFGVPGAGSSQVRLAVFDLLGREVATLVDGRLEVGRHAVSFDAAGLPSGLYVYRLQSGPSVESRRMLLMK